MTPRKQPLIRAAVLCLFCSAACGGDLDPIWPQWRGPTRDGRASMKSAWPDALSESLLVETWRIELGPGYSGPIVSSDRVFVTETRDKTTEVVQAVSRVDGKMIWSAEWPGAMSVPFFARQSGEWIRATPAFDGESLFVAGMRDVLVCLNADNGDERWRVDFADRFKSSLPAFGCVSSPLIDGEFVYVQAGGAFVKLNKQNGDTVWRALEDGGGMSGSAFSSPCKAEIAGRTQLVVQTRQRLAGLDESTGSELWSQEIQAFRGMNILTPVIYGDSIFTSSYGGKAWLFDLASGNADSKLNLKQCWENKSQCYMSTPVIVDRYLYAHLRNQRFVCIDLATGENRWTSTPFGKYCSLVTQGNKILALDEQGDLLLIGANPEKFELLDKRHVSDSSTWAHVAICGEEVFIRDLEGLTSFRWSVSQQDGVNKQ